MFSVFLYRFFLLTGLRFVTHSDFSMPDTEQTKLFFSVESSLQKFSLVSLT